MSLQLKWQYVRRTVPGVGTVMLSIEEDLRDNFFPALLRGEEVDADFWKILGHSVKHGGLVILDARFSEESAYNTSKAATRKLVDSLLGSSTLNYVGQRECVHRASAVARKEWKHVDMADLARQKDLSGGQERKHLHRSMRIGM